MRDPTYDRDKIRANPVWEVAFILSEVLNDNAPIGWGRYIYASDELARHFTLTPKTAGLPGAGE